jgi:hypothetical protein
MKKTTTKKTAAPAEQRVPAQDTDGNTKIAEPASHTPFDDVERHQLAKSALVRYAPQRPDPITNVLVR